MFHLKSLKLEYRKETIHRKGMETGNSLFIDHSNNRIWAFFTVDENATHLKFCFGIIMYNMLIRNDYLVIQQDWNDYKYII